MDSVKRFLSILAKALLATFGAIFILSLFINGSGSSDTAKSAQPTCRIEYVDFETETVEDDTITDGDSGTRQTGVDGKEEVCVDDSSTVVSRRTVSEPVMQINVVGTKEPEPLYVESYTEESSGASAKCRDGTLSYSANRRGTCSHHGGVAVWY